MAETSTFGSSIPVPSSSVKSVMSGLLVGLSIKSREYGLTLGFGVTSGQFTLAIARLLGVQREVIVRARLQIGDMWIQWQADEFKSERASWHADLRERIPDLEKREKYLRMFHECGGVALRWPEKHRTDKYGWTYLLKHEVTVGGDVVKRGASCSVPLSLRAVARVLRDDGEFMDCLSVGDKAATVYVPVDLPVRDERTVNP